VVVAGKVKGKLVPCAWLSTKRLVVGFDVFTEVTVKMPSSGI
jgi:hypothetical protein